MEDELDQSSGRSLGMEFVTSLSTIGVAAAEDEEEEEEEEGRRRRRRRRRREEEEEEEEEEDEDPNMTPEEVAKAVLTFTPQRKSLLKKH